MGDYQPHSIKRLLMAGVYAWQGLCATFRSEAAFREEVYIAVICIPIAFLLDVTTVERILLVAVIFALLIAELLNSAIEAIVDRIGSELHPLSGKAKDIGSAAVMLSILLTVFTWASILWQFV